jgi:hypothetical protein
MASIAVAVEPRLSVPALAIEPDPDPSEIPHLYDAEAFVGIVPLDVEIEGAALLALSR